MSVSLRKLCAAALLRRRCRREAGHRSHAVPGLGAFAVEEVDDLAIERRVHQGQAAAFAEKDGDGHAPDALAADAPVGAGGDHVGDALFAPGWVPDDLVDLLDAELAEGGFGAVFALDRSFQADEPLFGGAEDDGIVAAPAMRVGVVEGRRGQQCAALLKHFHDDGIRGPDGLAFKRRKNRVWPCLFVDMDAA